MKCSLSMGVVLLFSEHVWFTSCIAPCKWVNGKKYCEEDETKKTNTASQPQNNWMKQTPHGQVPKNQNPKPGIKPGVSPPNNVNNRRSSPLVQSTKRVGKSGTPAAVATVVPINCSKMEHQLYRDLDIALAASSSSSEVAVSTIHLVYIHIHGQLDRYYHFVHDALLTFYPLYTSFLDEGKNPTLSRVVLWNKISYGPVFTKIFEHVYGVKVIELPCKCPKGACAEITTDLSRVGSMHLDSKSVIDGLYPFYFDDAIKFVELKTLGNSFNRPLSQQEPSAPPPLSPLSDTESSSRNKKVVMSKNSHVSPPLNSNLNRKVFGMGRIVLVERKLNKLIVNQTVWVHGKNHAAEKEREREIAREVKFVVGDIQKTDTIATHQKNHNRPPSSTGSQSQRNKHVGSHEKVSDLTEQSNDENQDMPFSEEGGWVGRRLLGSKHREVFHLVEEKLNSTYKKQHESNITLSSQQQKQQQHRNRHRAEHHHHHQHHHHHHHQPRQLLPVKKPPPPPSQRRPEVGDGSDSSVDASEFTVMPHRNVGIVNHEELKHALIEKYGSDRVENVKLEDMSFEQQVLLFSHAQVVIAQHGAGLVNILFGKPSSLVIELCPRLHVMYEHLSRHRKMAYSYFNDCESETETKFPEVNIQRVIQVIDNHLKSSNWEG